MSTGLRITDLPAEIRRQIFCEYFAITGGYVYNGQSDKLRTIENTPIDLSLIYTCRSIANDCKRLPLAVNTIQFSTLYREDWRSLAGCFNLVATYYYVLQQDIVLHLAHLITPEMHMQLEKKFPNFRSKLEIERAFHFRVWDTGDDNTSQVRFRPAACQFVDEFFEWNIDCILPNHRYEYDGYGFVHNCVRHSATSTRDNHRRVPGLVDRDFRRWDKYSGEIRQCLTHCLQLIAEEYPEEFGDHVFTCLPHWRGKYPAHDFLGLRFETWAIPSRSQVASAMDRLGIPDFAWKLPDTWIYEENPLSLGPPEFDDEDPPFDFEFRTREKIRFSAAASAIRFIGLLSTTQRTSIRTIVLHEDSPYNAVSISSIPFTLFANVLPPYGRYYIFQQRVHYCIARDQAWPKCLEEGLLQPLTDSQVEVLRGRFTLDDDFKNAILQLVNQSSTVFRCDFDPGVPQGCEAFVNAARAIIPGNIWEYWSITEWLNNYINLARTEEDKDATLRQYDIQAGQECILSWVSIGALWETQDDR
ncbi:hypothetical protein FCULG_00008931 [Fusarium culmorum]|uniref:Uncharacterized protein n=1 Tax=Fusarium culmorum TaxID=5516 RepID=A0A2T4H135_FUSCU|nr:hypothetical protein FCULG_00008931 [Fusarium culmorum]